MDVHGTVLVRSVTGGPTSAGALVRRPLPSRQAVLSTASYGSRMLAIDARHTLFLSTDSGGHWKRVSEPWQGHAVEVNLRLGAGASGQAGANVSIGSLGALAGLNQQAANGPVGSLTGTVTDSTGAAIPHATVTVTDVAAKNTQTVKTNDTGRFAVNGLTPGNYNLEAAAPGFEPLHLGSIAVGASRPAVANLKLQVGASSETVTVEADSTSLRRSEMGGETADKKAAAAPVDALQPPAAFEITTNSGERWTSADGRQWKRE